MAQYKTGTASVTNGSAVVTGSGTLWLANVTAGDGFVLQGVPVPYTVASVDSDTQITLSAPWAGSSASGSIYAIFRDFTTQYNLPELAQGDIETATIWTRALRLIDQLQAASVVNHEAASDPHPQYLLDTQYEQDRLRESLLAEATLNLDFANNKYEVYEGPVDSLTARPFNDVLDFTRSGPASARNATGGISNVLADEQRLVGNREGLLIEEQRTNLLSVSEDFANGYWTKGAGTSIASDAIDSPLAGVQADKMVESADTQSKTILGVSSVSASTDYSRSIFVKYGGRQWIYLQQFDGATNRGAWFDVLSGVVGTVNPGMTASIDGPFGAGWYRCSVKNTTSSGASQERLQVSLAQSDGGASSYTGDGTSGVYLWGAQLEEGSFPTSYIKTEGSQVTRSADSCSRTLGAEFNPEEWTLFVDADHTSGELVGLGGGSFNDTLRINVPGADQLVRGTGAGFTQSVSIPGAVTGANRIAISFDGSGITACVNGVLAGSDASVEFPAPTVLEVGQTYGSNTLTGGVKGIRIIPRALTEAELIALTSGGN